MEYFKVKEIGRDCTLEVNREHDGDFVFRAHEVDNNCEIELSSTEAKDLADFILKRLSEESPHECTPIF